MKLSFKCPHCGFIRKNLTEADFKFKEIYGTRCVDCGHFSDDTKYERITLVEEVKINKQITHNEVRKKIQERIRRIIDGNFQ